MQLKGSTFIVTGGASSEGTVTLAGPAPQGGAVVRLTSSSPSLATVSSSVRVPAGVTSAVFSVTTKAGRTGSTTISATYAGRTRAATLTIKRR